MGKIKESTWYRITIPITIQEERKGAPNNIYISKRRKKRWTNPREGGNEKNPNGLGFRGVHRPRGAIIPRAPSWSFRRRTIRIEIDVGEGGGGGVQGTVAGFSASGVTAAGGGEAAGGSPGEHEGEPDAAAEERRRTADAQHAGTGGALGSAVGAARGRPAGRRHFWTSATWFSF